MLVIILGICLVMFSQPIRISQVNICTDVHYNANDVLAFCIPGADTHYYIGHAICPFYFLNEDVSNDVTESWLINHIRERQAKWIGHVMRGNTHSLSLRLMAIFQVDLG